MRIFVLLAAADTSAGDSKVDDLCVVVTIVVGVVGLAILIIMFWFWVEISLLDSLL